MKIVHILNYIPNGGNGIVCATVDLACEQSKVGHEVYIVSGGGEFVSLVHRYGVHHILIDQRRRPLNILKALYHLHNFFSDVKPDIVHGQMITGVVLAWALKLFHSYNLVSTVHNEFDRAAILMGLADKVIAVSYAVGISMVKKGINKKKLSVIRNGTIGSVRETISEERAVILQKPSITTVAGMFKRKGIDCIIKAFEIIKKDVPDAHLYLVGDGDDRREFEALAARTDYNSDIHFEGFQKNPKEYLKQSDVFILASLKDPCPLVLSEARDAGCAVVGTSVDGIPEMLEEGKAGQLFQVDNHKELADIVIPLLCDPSNLKLWRDNARQGLEWLSTKRVCDETLRLYREL